MKQLLIMIHIITRAPTESPWKSLAILFLQIIGVALILLLGLGSLFWCFPHLLSENQQNTLYAILLYGFLYRLISRYRKQISFSTRLSIKALGWGFLSSVLLVIICWAVALYFNGLAINTPEITGLQYVQIIIEAIVLACAVAWIEELFFRGLILGILEKGYRLQAAALWQALIFSGLHQLNTQWSWPLRIGSGIGLFLAGLVLGLARQKSNGLGWSIGLHAGWIFICQWGVRGWGLSLPIPQAKAGIFMVQEVNPVSGIPAILLLTGVSYVIMNANRTLTKDVQDER
jgi:membrane protease YdiL (CAAX protease family)